MSNYIVDGSDLTSVANAIRAKSGGSGQLAFPAGFVSEIGSISSGLSVDDLCNRSNPSGAIVINSATSVGGYAFMGRTGITSVSSDTVTTIYLRAFSDCTNLLDVSFPNLVYLRNNSSGTNSTSAGGFFGGCTKLRSVYMPKLQYMYGNGCFSNSPDSYACGTTALVIVLPALKAVSNVCFQYCYAQLYDIGLDCTNIAADAFYGRSAAFQRNRTIILRRDAGVTAAASADSIREITDVYCPQSMISTYQNATNWKTRYTGGYITFHAIEGSVYETKYADSSDCPIRYINKTLTNCTSSSTAKHTSIGNAYTTTLTASSGYTMDSVTVTMGGVDVTSTVYDSQTHVISIPAVDGTIQITASAV